MTWQWILISNGGNFEVWSTLQGLGRYQGRFDNDVLMSKGVLCANDHKVAWALGKRTIRIWSSLNCSQAPPKAISSKNQRLVKKPFTSSHVAWEGDMWVLSSFNLLWKDIFSRLVNYESKNQLKRHECFGDVWSRIHWTWLYDALPTASKTFLVDSNLS